MVHQSREEAGRTPVKKHDVLMPALPHGSVVDDKKTIKRIKEKGYDIHRTAAKIKQPKVISQRNQEFPDHWTRYRTAR